MSAPFCSGAFGVTVSSPALVTNAAGALFTRTEDTFSRKSRLKRDRSFVARAWIVVVPDSRSVVGW